MARQEATSIFSDGLMSDLHPINTPKSVLTDCLNGTFITYNGNEFVLQNDMGNYKLRNCKLPTNFIPVGVKGYADILYIVSYNPITKEVEIGSYPAPQSIFTTGEVERSEPNNDELSPFIVDNDEYPSIINEQKKPLYVFTANNEETFKLNPGDEFQFTGDPDIPKFVYQHLDFYIIDEDNKLYDIDDNELYIIGENGLTLETRLRKVFWETPGWLAAQYNLYVPDKFNLSIRTLTVPEFFVNTTNTASTLDDTLDERKPTSGFKVSLDLTSQTIISDLLFQAELINRGWDSNVEHPELKIRYIIDQSDSSYGEFQGIISSGKDYESTKQNNQVIIDIPCRKHNYQDDIITAYTNDRAIWFMPPLGEGQTVFEYPGKISIQAYPILNQDGKILKFTQFETSINYALNNLKDKNDIQVANSIYKWATDSDSITVSFNIDGPFINNSSIEGSYSLYKLEYQAPINVGDNPYIEIETPLIDQPIPNLSLFGQNTFNIPAIYEEKSVFKLEEGVFKLVIKLTQGTEELNTTSMIIIPSIVFNDYFGTLDSYDRITTSEWVQKWWDHFSVSKVDVTQLNYKVTGIDDSNIWGQWSDSIIESKKNEKHDLYTFLTNAYNAKIYNTGNATVNWKPVDKSTFPTFTVYFPPLFANNDDQKVNYSVTINKLDQALWTPNYSVRIELNQNGGDTQLYLNYEGDKWTDELVASSLTNKITATAYTVQTQNYTEYFPYVEQLSRLGGTSLSTTCDVDHNRWWMSAMASGKGNTKLSISNGYSDSTGYSREKTTVTTKAEKDQEIDLNNPNNKFTSKYDSFLGNYPLAVIRLHAICKDAKNHIYWYISDSFPDQTTNLIHDEPGSGGNDSYSGYSGLLMKTADGNPIYLDFHPNPSGNKNNEIEKALYQLSRYGLRITDGTYKTGYVPDLESVSGDNYSSVTLNRYNVQIDLTSLTYGGINWIGRHGWIGESLADKGFNLTNSQAVIDMYKRMDAISLSNSCVLNVNVNTTVLQDYIKQISNFVEDNQEAIDRLSQNDTIDRLYFYSQDEETEYKAALKNSSLSNPWTWITVESEKPLNLDTVTRFFGSFTSNYNRSNIIFDSSSSQLLVCGDSDGGDIAVGYYQQIITSS